MRSKKETITPLVIAACSVVFINTIEPLIQMLGQTLQARLARTANKYNLDIQLDSKEAEAAGEVISPSPAITQAIGFQIPSEENNNGEW